MGGLRGYLCFLRTFYTLGDGVATFNFYATANVKGFDVYSLYPRQNGAPFRARQVELVPRGSVSAREKSRLRVHKKEGFLFCIR